MTNVACPLCGKWTKADWPYDSVVRKHLHPIRRYWYWFLTGRNYGAWLEQYWSDFEQLTGRKRDDR